MERVKFYVELSTSNLYWNCRSGSELLDKFTKYGSHGTVSVLSTQKRQLAEFWF